MVFEPEAGKRGLFISRKHTLPTRVLHPAVIITTLKEFHLCIFVKLKVSVVTSKSLRAVNKIGDCSENKTFTSFIKQKN